MILVVILHQIDPNSDRLEEEESFGRRRRRRGHPHAGLCSPRNQQIQSVSLKISVSVYPRGVYYPYEEWQYYDISSI